MISIPVWIYVRYRAKQLNLRKPKHIGIKLKKYKQSVNARGYFIVFSCFQSMLTGTINAGSIIPKLITVSPEWAARVILFDNEETKNALNITIGHELAHKDGDFAIVYWERKTQYFIYKEDRKFVNWVTEVHHDFAAAEKMAASSKEKLLLSIEYKSLTKPDSKDTFSHPSWETRKEYIEFTDPESKRTGEFSEVLISKIAKDTHCNNNELMERIWQYYKLIILH